MPFESRSEIGIPSHFDFIARNNAVLLNSSSTGESSAAAHKRKRHGQETRQLGTRLPTAAELFVPSLPGIPNLATHPTHPLHLYAGEIPSYPGEGQGGGEGATGKDAKLFFMMAKARRSAGKQRLLFWFNGGPGCSSFDGSLMEVGPFRTVPASETESGKVEVKLVDGGWEEYANVVFVDQPPGTGFSYVPTNGYLHELDQGAAHLIKFLQNFYTIFPEFAGVDTYLAGESFAGQYIPYFADAILKSNALQNFPLKGIAIGNGWIDPKQQYPGYVDFAYEKGLIKQGTPEAEKLDAALKACEASMEKYTDPYKTPSNINHCGEVMDSVTDSYVQELNGKKVCMNVYDVRLVDDWPACGMNWPPDLSDVYTFLRRDDVISALHAKEKETAWVECDNKVSAELHLRNSPASVALLPGILEKGVPILMFAGTEDLICNYKGIERIVDNLIWEGQQGMGNATVQKWYLNDTQVGTWQSSRGMQFAQVFDSSHMVGFDVPHVTNDMIMRFMDVDLALLPGLAAQSSSRLGDVQRVAVSIGASAAAGMPLLKGGATDWDAWYNIISALLILFILISIVAIYFYFRRRGALRRSRMGLGFPREDGGDLSERIPLGSERVELDDIERAERYNEEYLDGDVHDQERRKRKGKGKGKERYDEDEEDTKGETVFALGDEDEDK
ncbi:pheromone-processing carboxypeptidase KEX1 [Kwoniella mangroviensis CBS 10435]|uniref:Pheromone-processing carboxypeptidase KEX1 n=1 Tax=Kwoniella mangroviensis CBS 10435 TaxID=1331196 RepID=A0A1B9J1N9_9TREE|nr:pheromone-processing carboxypeptidase KEX1 [Kwoniella mangroviensis CBS 10435]OCF77719.1 pheromone-processing carboxypeptidase KEX1 [Kwoniella mangroviensis CBS 8886]